MSRIVRGVGTALYVVCPLLAIGSLFYFDFPWAGLGFFGFGFLGMFAGSAAKRRPHDP